MGSEEEEMQAGVERSWKPAAARTQKGAAGRRIKNLLLVVMIVRACSQESGYHPPKKRSQVTGQSDSSQFFLFILFIFLIKYIY